MWPQCVMTSGNRFLPTTLASLRVLVETTLSKSNWGGGELRTRSVRNSPPHTILKPFVTSKELATERPIFCLLFNVLQNLSSIRTSFVWSEATEKSTCILHNQFLGLGVLTWWQHNIFWVRLFSTPPTNIYQQAPLSFQTLICHKARLLINFPCIYQEQLSKNHLFPYLYHLFLI